MYYPDLSRECQADHGPYVRAIGWLAKKHPFPTGQVPADILAVLKAHLKKAWQPAISAGIHRCDLCDPSAPNTTDRVGTRNLWIPSREVVYVAPELIGHYIEAHGYQPPEEYLAAVVACPPQKSPEFLERIRGFGHWAPGPELVRA
jgi:hypothetical protein